MKHNTTTINANAISFACAARLTVGAYNLACERTDATHSEIDGKETI